MFGKQHVFAEDKPGEAQVTLCESNLAKSILEWEPKKNIEDYIEDYLNK
jgi:nucleoside-diphosphate-sugar epimerase